MFVQHLMLGGILSYSGGLLNERAALLNDVEFELFRQEFQSVLHWLIKLVQQL